MKKWEELPIEMQVDEVRPYYDILKRKQFYLFLKRTFDIVVSFLMLVILSPVFLILTFAIKFDSPGPVFFRQVRVTQYGKKFRIFKFRSMVSNAEKLGAQVTTAGDVRVTRVGRIIRKFRLDEIPQLFNIISGDMTFVGTRPEVLEYVEKYSEEMMATLLLPAGVTSEASIQYKDEELLLANADTADEIYLNQVLHKKMKYNLNSIKELSFSSDIKIMIRTMATVINR